MLKKIIKSILISSIFVIGGGLYNCHNVYGYEIDLSQSKKAPDTLLVDYQFKNYAEKNNALIVDNNKVWEIKFNNKLSINNDMYNYIYVLDKNNKKVPITLKLKDNDSCTIQVIPKNNYIFEKEYELVLAKGLNGVNSVLKNKTIKKFKIAPNIKSFCMFQVPLYSSCRCCSLSELNSMFKPEGLDSYIMVKATQNVDNIYHWPIEWNKEDIEKIPKYKFCGDLETNFIVTVVKPGTYYVRGHFAGFDPKSPTYSFTQKFEIDKDSDKYYREHNLLKDKE
ncbi:hypothetical protein [Clostridium novyi]|uniref:Uncharacterized protein n=1 Tax=Clostridium novyi (strain NT) TaxID=386415 RepID=A0PYI7_CLONN|nr:hypothetical protein [Clostridium novyi]ABK61219.1 hypothetical protein NT01CX_1356 [Clostridium novyi NT]KEH85602.1 hypothetical protein Z966_06050 [Clostridium novyi A str. NCTC 538]